MSGAESSSEESEIESDTNDSGGSSKTETSMPERVGNRPSRGV